MYTVQKRLEIAASHSLCLPYESPCNNDHGHTYLVDVTVQATELNECGMVCDFSLIKRAIHGELDHMNLNEALSPLRPTSEALAMWVANRTGLAIYKPTSFGLPIQMRNVNAKVTKVVVHESSTSSATWEA